MFFYLGSMTLLNIFHMLFFYIAIRDIADKPESTWVIYIIYLFIDGEERHIYLIIGGTVAKMYIYMCIQVKKGLLTG